MAKDQVINVRVSVEEKATLKKAAGAGGIGPYLRALGLAQANGVGPRTSVSPVARRESESSQGEDDADSGSEGRDSAATTSPMPKQNWRARVNQLMAQGTPRPAAERIADLEIRG